jgi:hypothetical protein
MFNNFHIIQFYFQFPLLIKSYDGCYTVVVVCRWQAILHQEVDGGCSKCQKYLVVAEI